MTDDLNELRTAVAEVTAWAEQERAPWPVHASGLALNQVRNALAKAGHEPSAIDWNHTDGRHSFTIEGPDGGTYRLTITAVRS